MHDICKVWGSNPGHHQKKKDAVVNEESKARARLMEGQIDSKKFTEN